MNRLKEASQGVDFIRWMLGPDYVVPRQNGPRSVLDCCPACLADEVELHTVEDESVTFACQECDYTWDEVKQ